MLYTVNKDRQATQLAYRIKFWPYKQLTIKATDLVRANKVLYVTKAAILSRCDETLQHIYIEGTNYKILWIYNNIPTEEEWSKKSDDFLIRIELRNSPVIKERTVALLDFELHRPMPYDLMYIE